MAIATEKIISAGLVTSRKLRGIMAEYGISTFELSQEMKIPESTLLLKIDGRCEWLFCETMYIVKRLGFSGFRDVFPEIYNYVLKT